MPRRRQPRANINREYGRLRREQEKVNKLIARLFPTAKPEPSDTSTSTTEGQQTKDETKPSTQEREG